VITQSSSATVNVSVGDEVEVELVSQSFGRDGHIVPWGRPTLSDLAILVPNSSPSAVVCPQHATCAFFSAYMQGVISIQAIGPSGIVCDQHGNECIGVMPALWKVNVQVGAS